MEQPSTSCASPLTSDDNNVKKEFKPPTLARLVFCPVCNNSFPADVIEEHADICSETRYKSPFVVNLIDDDINDNSDEDISNTDYDYFQGDNTEEVDLKASVRKFITELRPTNENENKINVRRMNAFADCQKFFSRSWNRNKKENKMIITFLGEAGVDTGGPLREFFSCEYCNFDYIQVIMTSK